MDIASRPLRRRLRTKTTVCYLRISLVISVLSSLAWAESSVVTYFTIQESLRSSNVEKSSMEPWEVLASPANKKRSVLSLLSWQAHNDKLESPKEPFRRRQHYGTWIRRRDGTCYNTRAHILIRTSQDPVEFNSQNPCLVSRGSWRDPFSGEWFYQARDIHIDHTVPVKDSYELGGHNWNASKRCAYFNFLGAQEHLVPISATENSKKADRAPDEYMPPNKSYWCTYLKNWLSVKLVWQLPLLPAEAQAIYQYAKDSLCEPKTFEITTKELQAVRSKFSEHFELCRPLKPQPQPVPPSDETDPEDGNQPVALLPADRTLNPRPFYPPMASGAGFQ